MGTAFFKITEMVCKSVSIMENTSFKCNLKQSEKANNIRGKKNLHITFIIIKENIRNTPNLQETLQSLEG